jgi:Rrf2 family transcriptional regulator, nitric oxide-sensitive transcriptional repressor
MDILIQKFSQTAEYALRAAVHMASHPDERQTTRDIAEAMNIPADYLAKVMQALVRAGVVTAMRGKSGGFQLTRPDTSVLEVVNAVDPIRRIPSCPLHLPHHAQRLCPLHSKLDATAAMLEQEFRNTCIADLAEKGVMIAGAGHER